MVLSLRRLVGSNILRHLQLLEQLQILDPNNDGRKLPIASHANALMPIHGSPEHFRKLSTQLPGANLMRNSVHSRHSSICVHN